ncbi:MAG: magnesium/cobalt transporter CorA [Bacteroidia bacterium]|nr:magnesium/cobalt transporter CorA [Bacteroidia bacterium]MCX7651779.1 magnesium/cobalt transporter CorA [Bacteroidia bacterium]MDW8416349.1 magnesium/cobalt transporter CorA [Bacteroidia bacterium]
MIRAYCFQPYNQIRWNDGELSPAEMEVFSWIDSCGASKEALQKIEEHFNIRFPSKQEQAEIEASSRYHEENQQLRITLRLIEIRPFTEELILQEQDLSIIWTPERLFTHRTQDSRVFQELVRRVRSNPELHDSSLRLLLALLGQIVDVDADNIELISQHIHRFSAALRDADFSEREKIILAVQSVQEYLIRLREGLFDIQRVLSLLIRSQKLTDSTRESVRILLKDVSSLIDHTSFSFQRLESIQNTILSLINLEQNRIIKIFTVITVAFMPPTLIASIYGMNFRFMPELDWEWGYAFAWILIVGSSIATVWYFRWRHWL